MANKNLIFCDEATLSKDISGKTYVVTGANSGVGLETTRLNLLKVLKDHTILSNAI